jgi:hypothetical protein
VNAPAHWATDSPELTERERETAADKRLYVEIGLAPVRCDTCGVEVGVKKNSRKHTSVQWTSAAMRGCDAFTAHRSSGSTELLLGCPRLKDSIEAAVRDGALVVPDD